ncbi:hypothetical protein LTS18_012124 [Coniosporium uncinatum]|uniref:Uncharacterized protein n=1 Tax=Coniosporium uncinatum TaxID=93489 RepID=A0ACC3DJW1_9PEZI|nr:hypothetical protein LTS18_012124 [Coniosporium uncinatum]
MSFTPRFTRSLLNLRSAKPYPYICPRCAQSQSRSFSVVPRRTSGHSKWATIKHDKAKKDAAAMKQNSAYAQEIAQASRLFGPDPNTNPRLALAIDKAKKSQMPKDKIQAAVARGQGKSASGAKLESIVIEAMMPPGVAVLVGCETDNKSRTIGDVRVLIKKYGGTVGNCTYMFQKKGAIKFKPKDGVGVDEVLEPALDAGALDVTEEDEQLIVLTEPSATKTVSEAITGTTGLEIESEEIIWDPNEDTMAMVDPDSEEASALDKFMDDVKEVPMILDIYTNHVLQDVQSAQT